HPAWSTRRHLHGSDASDASGNMPRASADHTLLAESRWRARSERGQPTRRQGAGHREGEGSATPPTGLWWRLEEPLPQGPLDSWHCLLWPVLWRCVLDWRGGRVPLDSRGNAHVRLTILRRHGQHPSPVDRCIGLDASPLPRHFRASPVPQTNAPARPLEQTRRNRAGP
ncbi:MAG: hypothetical protein RI968_367, partial [Pseudomonadota bacterium]